jgi:hypothetical protein
MTVAPIIIYIHVCQKLNWHISFNKIMDAIIESGLYDNCKEIRLGIVNDHGQVHDSPRLNDPKISTIFYNHSSLYERATLLHMKKSSETDHAQYLYCHTKGIKHLDGSSGEHTKQCVMDWVDLMIHFNIYKWRTANQKLLTHDIYGCEFFNEPQMHFSGNFWWANSDYIKTLPQTIGNEYWDPEFWICKRHDILICNIHSTGLPDGGSLYNNRYIKGVHYH